MSTKGLAYTSMFADRPNNFGIAASEYVPTPANLRLGNNLNDYASNFGRYTDMNGVATGSMPSKAAFDAVDISKAPSVFNEKGLFDWSLNEAGKGGSFVASPQFSDGMGNLYGSAADANKMQAAFSMDDVVTPINNIGNDGGGFTNWLGSDAAKNAIGIGGLALSGFGARNNYKAGKQAKKQWEAENARANEIMAMNREKYQTYKADKARLNSGYSGSGLAASGGN